MKTCKVCQCILTKKYQKQFCSLSCAGKVNANKNKPNFSIIYNQNPKLCEICHSYLPYTKRHNKYCGRSCAASFSNRNRLPRSQESKEKTVQTMKKLYKEGKILLERHSRKGIPNKIPTELSKKYYECHCCRNIFERTFYAQKCCSVACRDSVRSQNKCAKVRISYFNRNENIEVNLQSSWELSIAKWLDEKNIAWTRPSKRLHWFDTTNQKWRTYLPDFYLTTAQKFLDVKNPMKMKEDADKIKQLTQLFPLCVGNREEIRSTVLNWYSLTDSNDHD